jgi:thiamine-phosphate diphosphorylase
LGKQAIIGISTHTLSEAIQAERDGADYIGFGPIFSTDTKTDAKTPVGIPAITEIAKAVRIPLYAIGGIGLPDLLQIFSAGATGVAAISAFTGDVQPNLRSWLKAIV